MTSMNLPGNECVGCESISLRKMCFAVNHYLSFTSSQATESPVSHDFVLKKKSYSSKEVSHCDTSTTVWCDYSSFSGGNDKRLLSSSTHNTCEVNPITGVELQLTIVFITDSFANYLLEQSMSCLVYKMSEIKSDILKLPIQDSTKTPEILPLQEGGLFFLFLLNFFLHSCLKHDLNN